jgi:hypothetical protein
MKESRKIARGVFAAVLALLVTVFVYACAAFLWEAVVGRDAYSGCMSLLFAFLSVSCIDGLKAVTEE